MTDSPIKFLVKRKQPVHPAFPMQLYAAIDGENGLVWARIGCADRFDTLEQAEAFIEAQAILDGNVDIIEVVGLQEITKPEVFC